MNYQEFNKRAVELVHNLAEKGASLPWENVEFYNLWLAQTHTFVQKSSEFLRLCYEGLSASHPLKARFKEHIAEESGHEKMSQNDLKFMQVKKYESFEVTQVFWRSQYYWIREEGPTSHMGYVILLEGLAAVAGPKILKRLQQSGYKGITFLKVHAEEDQDHFAEALESMKPLTALELQNAYDNLVESTKLYELMLDQCNQACAKPMKATA